MGKILESCRRSETFETRYKGDCHRCPCYKSCYQKKRQMNREIMIEKRARQTKLSIIMLVFLCCTLCILAVSKRIIDFSDENQLNTEEAQTEVQEESESTAIISPFKPSDTYYYNVSDEDKLYMAKVVYAEARGEIYDGKVAVAAVILNRLTSGDKVFDTKSIQSVISQPGQFASIDWITSEMLEAVPECMEAVEDACKGWDPTRFIFPEGAKFFYAPDLVTGERAREREGVKVMKIGNHNFHNDFR